MRNEIITQINDLFDEITELKHQIKQQNDYYDTLYENSNKNEIYGMTDIQKKLYDIGLNHLFKEGFSPYFSFQDYGSDEYYSFEKWRDKSIELHNFDDITKNEFIKLFNEKMKLEYEKRLEKAKKEDK